jgi:tartrate dehydratase alpha subunit/fumarate hydratase class I-like protein
MLKEAIMEHFRSSMHWNQWASEDEIEVRLILKGGGCENTNIQYSLPCELPHLGIVDRTLDGVRQCILHAAGMPRDRRGKPVFGIRANLS